MDRSEWQQWDRGQVAQEIASFWDGDPFESAHRDTLADMVAHRLGGPTARVLEVGCGSGAIYRRLVPRHLENRNYVGVDISEKMLAIARRESPLGQYARADGFSLCFKDRAFDLVLCFEVLGHLPEIAPFIQELLRTTRSICVFTVWPSSGDDLTETHEEIGGARFLHRCYSDSYVRRAIRACACGRSAGIEVLALSAGHWAYIVRPGPDASGSADRAQPPGAPEGAQSRTTGGARSARVPRVLAVLPHAIPSTLLQIVKPLTDLHRRGEIVADITLEPWVSTRSVARADVVTFCRNIEPAYREILALARSLHHPILYDLDDNFFELGNSYPDERRHFTAEKLAQLEIYLRQASLVRVYSELLRERVRLLNERVVRVDGAIDWSLVPAAAPRRDAGKVRIVYPTSRYRHDDLAELFLGDVAEILRVYRGRVELCCWGYHPPQLRGDPAVRFLDFLPDYDRYFHRFARAGFDVGLAPLRDDVFHRSKANAKFREFAAARIAGVYSNVDVYADCVTEGQTGLLVGTERGSWFKAISRLIEDGELRARIQAQSFEYARKHYSLAKTEGVWIDHIRTVLAPSPASAAAPRDRVDRVRSASWPSGATRVGSDIIREMRTNGVRSGLGRLRRRAKEARFLAKVRWDLGPGLWWRSRERAVAMREARKTSGSLSGPSGLTRQVPNRPRVLAVLPQLIPSTILTVVKPLIALHRAGRIVADITLESLVPRRKLMRADVVIFCRNREPQYARTLAMARALGLPTVYEIDDDLFDPPDSYVGESNQATPERRTQLERYVRDATLVRVYSEPLRERALALNPRVVRVEGPIDWTLLPSVSPARDRRRVRIVYATGRIREDPLADMFLGDLQQALRTHAGRVEFHCWGYHPRELEGQQGVVFHDFQPDYDRFFRQFASGGFDVGLAPLRDDVFHRSKSNNKFREYAAARIAGIYSDVEVYSSCVTDGRTGLLVSAEPGAWFRALSRLIEDEELRARIQEQAFAYAREHYGLEKTQEVWFEHLREVIAAGPDAAVGLAQDAAVAAVGAERATDKLIRAVGRGLYLIRAMKRHGARATVNRIRRTWKDWRLLLGIKWQLRRLGSRRESAP